MSKNEPTKGQLLIGEYASEAAKEYAMRHSVALVMTQSNGGVDVGSGTCVRLKDRYLVATAGHNLSSSSDESIHIVAPKSSGYLPARIVASGKGPNDVGWLELKPETEVLAALTFLDARDLDLHDEPSESSLYLAHGLPAKIASVKEELISLASLGFMTIPAPTNGDADGSSLILDYSSPRESLPIPSGMSGGGVWSLQTELEPRVWSAENSKLVGIIRSWDKIRDHLTATRIGVWLDAVEKATEEHSF